MVGHDVSKCDKEEIKVFVVQSLGWLPCEQLWQRRAESIRCSELMLVMRKATVAETKGKSASRFLECWWHGALPVSYTHLTLPTRRTV